jgi:hypothetical protein
MGEFELKYYTDRFSGYQKIVLDPQSVWQCRVRLPLFNILIKKVPTVILDVCPH